MAKRPKLLTNPEVAAEIYAQQFSGKLEEGNTLFPETLNLSGDIPSLDHRFDGYRWYDARRVMLEGILQLTDPSLGIFTEYRKVGRDRWEATYNIPLSGKEDRRRQREAAAVRLAVFSIFASALSKELPNISEEFLSCLRKDRKKEFTQQKAHTAFLGGKRGSMYRDGEWVIRTSETAIRVFIPNGEGVNWSRYTSTKVPATFVEKLLSNEATLRSLLERVPTEEDRAVIRAMAA